MARVPRPVALGLALVLAGLLGACSGVDASAAPGLRYAVFLGQMVAASEAIETGIQDLVEAGSGAGIGKDADDVRASAESLAAIAAEQQAWLDENPPADCYHGAHALAGRVADELRAASTRVIEWADAMEQPALADPTAAFAEVVAVSGSVQDVVDQLGAEMDAVTCLD